MKVLLVKPYSYGSAKGVGPPIGLLYIASALKKLGHHVFVHDFMINKSNNLEIIKAVLQQYTPDIVGVTCNSHERFQATTIINGIKSINTNLKIVIGGHHPSLLPLETLEQSKNIDYLIEGYGEEIFCHLLTALANKGDLSFIPNLWFRNKDTLYFPKRRMSICTVDENLIPDWSLLDIHDYDIFLPLDPPVKAIPIISSRGCPFKCSFCAAAKFSNRIFFRSLQSIINEIKFLQSSMGKDFGFFFFDDNFLLKKARINEFCNTLLKENLSITWGCYGRADTMFTELAKKMRQSGCHMISFGIESGSNRILQRIDKGITEKIASATLKMLKKENIRTRCSFILGYPGENFFDIMKTFFFIIKHNLAPDEVVISYNLILYPETKITKELEKKGFFPESFSWNKPLTIKNYRTVPIYYRRFENVRKIFLLTLRNLTSFFYYLRMRQYKILLLKLIRHR